MNGSAAALRLAVVGNPANRRVGLFCTAACSLGLPGPRVVPWISVLRGEAAFAAGELVRIDSPGEDAEVARLLRGGDAPVDLYRVEGTKAWYAGFAKALESLQAQIEAAGAHALADAAETATAFDKARCHALLAERGVPVPRAYPNIAGFDDLMAALDEADTDPGAVFVKIRHGSSASGVVQVRRHPGSGRGSGSGSRSGSRNRITATTSVEMVRGRTGWELYNSLRVRQYVGSAAVGRLVDALAPDGLHVEQEIVKVDLDGAPTDFRLVTVAGRVTHAVGRSSDLPITNLHLGGRRRDPAACEARLGPARWAAVLALAEQAAACLPKAHCLGIDVLADESAQYVGEVNAYGDLLPNLPGRAGTVGADVDTYTAQLRSLIERHETKTSISPWI